MWGIRDYCNDDLEQMLKISRENYGDIEIANHDFVKWQYQKNIAGEAVIKLAKDSNIVVGQYIVIPMRFKVEDEVVDATLSLNTLTKKEYRGQGIFTALSEALFKSCSERDLDFTYGFPNQNSYPGFMKKLKFTDLGQVPLLLRPMNLGKLFEKKAGTVVGKITSSMNFIYNIKETSQSFDIYEINDNNISDIDILWNKIKDKYKIIGVRDSKYLKWRYVDIPQRNYKILAVRRKNEICGYIVGTFKEIGGFNSGIIADFVVCEDCKKEGQALVKEMLKHFKNSEVELAGALMLPNKSEYDCLKHNKFIKCPDSLKPQPTPIIFRAHTECGKNDLFMDLNNWFLTMGDYDVI